ncbi:hypothetical protein [Nostoc sp. CALU 1950]|uniref:hypothetical protein n=1 Tax=Nostoc sp. CALU 1950 TaxID=3104321 RepID=UPI003EC0B18C
MADLYSPKNAKLINEESLKSLIRTIKLSQGDFSLICVRCNYTSLRKRMIKQLQKLWYELGLPGDIKKLDMPNFSTTLYTTIKNELADEQPQALMIFGLESVNDIDQVLIAANYVRDEFRNFRFPIILWITDEIQAKFKFVPDFWSWVGGYYEFAMTAEELLTFILQSVNNNPCTGLNVDMERRFEVKLAWKELQTHNYSLDPELEASLRSLINQDDYK